MALEIRTLPCLSDNYVYLLHDAASGETAVIDVPDAAAVEAGLKAEGWTLNQILLTHHHYDHIDGVAALNAANKLAIIGHDADAKRLPKLSSALNEGDQVSIGQEAGEVIEVSGHTIGHIAYHFPASKALFSGDSLMVMGCGRLFEGSAEQMWASLSKLMALPPETRIYSGHEYTAANAKFALSIEPENKALIERVKQISEARARGEDTMGSTLAQEMATNPFLRAGLPQVKALVGMEGAPDAAVFAEIRERKDNF